MPYYDAYDAESGEYLGNVFIPYGDTDGGGKMSIISAIILYVASIFGCIGIIGSLIDDTSGSINFACIALVVFLLPVFIALFGKNKVKLFMSLVLKYAYIIFDLLIVLWWIVYLFVDQIIPVLTIICFASMYSMYYYPYKCIAKGTKVGAIITGALSLIIFLVTYNNGLELFRCPIIFPTCICFFGTFFIALHSEDDDDNGDKRKKVRKIIYIVLGYVLVVGSIGTAFLLNNSNKNKIYNNALDNIKNNEYAEARNNLDSVIRYKDSEKLYNEICFKNLNVGEIIHFAKYSTYRYDDIFESKNALYWSVLEVNNNEATLISNDIIDFTYAGAYESFETSNTFSYLNSKDFTAKYFINEEMDRIIPKRITNSEVYSQFFLLNYNKYNEYLKNDITEKIILDVKYNDYAQKYLNNYLKSDYAGFVLAQDMYLFEDISSNNPNEIMAVNIKDNKLYSVPKNHYCGLRVMINVSTL